MEAYAKTLHFSMAGDYRQSCAETELSGLRLLALPSCSGLQSKTAGTAISRVGRARLFALRPTKRAKSKCHAAPAFSPSPVAQPGAQGGAGLRFGLFSQSSVRPRPLALALGGTLAGER